MATSPNTNQVPKFRPYLSLEELTYIADLLAKEYVTNLTPPECKSALIAITKAKTLAEVGVKVAAYKTNPRPSLSDRLGFGDSVSNTNGAPRIDLANAINKEAPPDFAGMMNELEAAVSGLTEVTNALMEDAKTPDASAE